MSEAQEKPKKELVSINFKANKLFKMMLEEIGLSRGGMNLTETIKFCVSEYYYGEHRKVSIGYQAGHKTAERRDKKASIQEQLDTLEVMTDEELAAYIHEIGLITAEDEAQGAFFARTDAATGVRMIAFKYHGQESTSDRWTIGELKRELEKHLKSKMKKVS